MALRAVILKSATGKSECAFGGIRRWTHAAARPAPLQTPFESKSQSPIFPENQNNDIIGVEFPNTPFLSGYMELMAVPKRKTTPHKKGIRNGPKALKPVPVIIRCKACGRVKLPHFFCCSGIRPNPSE